jgi:hypothetical protein
MLKKGLSLLVVFCFALGLVFLPMGQDVASASTVTPQLAGGNHSLALKDDGTVWAWGRNKDGQLGDGTTANKSTPAQVTELSEVKVIACGGDHSLALKEDGTVWVWGRNSYGQLGDGTTVAKSTPVQVTGLSGIKAIAAGTDHSLALKGDGTVWAWGYNGLGQLGDGTGNSRYTPVQVQGLSGVKGINGGHYHSLALKEDGAVWAWGRNSDGELGDGTTTNRNAPVQVTGLSGIKTIIGAGNLSLALKEDGTVWAWGDNSVGQLGDGTTTDRNTPVQVIGLSGAEVIESGLSYGLALKEDGTVWAWGLNTDSQLGDGTTTNRNTPVQVIGLNLYVSPESPDAPTNLTATPGNARVTLSWDALTGASSYNVKRATTAGGPYTTVASSVYAASYVDTGLTNGTTYYYVVSAMTAEGESADSNEALATPSASSVSGNRAILEITMTTGEIKEYDLSMAEVESFVTWFENRSGGSGQFYYSIDKSYNVRPFLSRKENIVFDKIVSFEIKEYQD